MILKINFLVVISVVDMLKFFEKPSRSYFINKFFSTIFTSWIDYKKGCTKYIALNVISVEDLKTLKCHTFL